MTGHDWQRRAFGRALAEFGHYDWEDFQQRLIQSIGDWEGAPDTGWERSRNTTRFAIGGRFFLSAKTFAVDDLPDPGWRRWLSLLDVVPNFATDIGRRILSGYADVIDRRLPGIPGAELNTS